MKNINIPENVEAYKNNFEERALPDEILRSNDFYRRLAGWVMDVRTPILYEQDHDDEYTNFSINFNWLLLRDYSQSRLGSQARIATMYALHEMTHMTHRLPTRLDEVSATEYAEDFTRSEYRASNETEILIHYRVPEIRETVFEGMKIAFDILRDRGISQPSASELGLLRRMVIETDYLDSQFVSEEDKKILDWLKGFNSNREWAIDRFNEIKDDFTGINIAQDFGLTDKEYEKVISNYEPQFDQIRYEKNIIRNVKLGHAMCGLLVPEIEHIEQAIDLVKELEGHHAKTQS
jgi:hypothetical protein